MSITEFVESPAYKKIMGKVYGIGAAIVLAGALFKIMHYPGAELMLLLGMGTEIIIFLLSAFEPPHEMPDWSLVYPELVGLETDSAHGGGGRQSAYGGGGGSELAALIEAGQIEQQTVEKLSDGIKKLAVTSSQLSDLSDASLATESYLQNLKMAGESMSNLTTAQARTSEKLEESSNLIAESYSSVAKMMNESGQKMATDMATTGQSFIEKMNSSSAKLASSYETLSQNMSQQVETISGTNKNLQTSFLLLPRTWELSIRLTNYS